MTLGNVKSSVTRDVGSEKLPKYKRNTNLATETEMFPTAITS